MKNLLFFCFGFILILASCRTSAPPAAKAPAHTIDTLLVEKVVTYRDTVFVSPSAQAVINAPLKEISTGLKAPLITRSNQATATVRQVGTNLQFYCACDTVAIAAKIKETNNSKYQKNITQLPPKQVRYCPWYLKVLSIIGALTIILGTAFLLRFAFPSTPKS